MFDDENTPVESRCLRIPGDECHLTSQESMSRIYELRCTKWAFSLPRLRGNDTIQLQDCRHKGEAKNRVSLFCRHYSIFCSFCILKIRRKKHIHIRVQTMKFQSKYSLSSLGYQHWSTKGKQYKFALSW